MMWLIIIPLFFFGLFVFVRGRRGELVWRTPVCGKCNYDLRGHDPRADSGCPECGVRFAAEGAVRYAKVRHRPLLCGLGLTLMIVCYPAAMIVQEMGPGGAFRAGSFSQKRWGGKSNAAVMEGTGISPGHQQGNPFAWEELIRRRRNGLLTDEEMGTAMDQLIDLQEQIQEAMPGSTRAALSWTEDFFLLAEREGLIDDEQFARLCAVFFDEESAIQIRRRMREGTKVRFSLGQGGGQNLPGLIRCANLRRVVLDGEREIPVKPKHQFPVDLSRYSPWPVEGTLDLEGVEPGQHELVFEYEIGLVSDAQKKLMDQRAPGPMSGWPSTRRQWVELVKVPIEVVGRDQSVVALEHDSELAERVRKGLFLRGLSAHRRRDRIEVKLDLKYARRIPVPLCFEVFLRLGDEEYAMGSFWIASSTESWMNPLRHTFAELPVEWTVAAIILRPFIELAEQQPNIDRIWGEEIVLEGVPLRREDLGDGQ